MSRQDTTGLVQSHISCCPTLSNLRDQQQTPGFLSITNLKAYLDSCPFEVVLLLINTTVYYFLKVDVKKFREKVGILEGTVTHEDG